MNKLLFLSVLLLALPAQAGVMANYLDSNFEEQFKVTDLQSIEMWEQPRTQYTPKNLVSEQQMRFSGKNGTNRYESYTFHVTDYDTKIVNTARGSDGSYYIQDNTGKYFKTGEQGLTADQRQAIESIPSLKNQVTNMSSQIDKTNKRIDRLDNRMEQGFATVTDLKALHTNPRQKGKNQIYKENGMYKDN